MESVKLHIGKMTSREIAAWLGISYKWYSNSKIKQLRKVEDFCRFNEYRGGIEIYEIFNTYANIANIAGVTPYQAAKSAKKFFGPCFGEDGLMGWRQVSCRRI